MRKLIILTLLLLPSFAFAQKVDVKPFKGADKIVIKNNLSAEENYKLVLNTLLDKDYFIDKKDNEYFTVTTQAKKVGKWTYSSFFNVRAKNKEIIFQGMFKTGIEMNVSGVVSPDNFEPIVYKSFGGYKMTFKDMENVSLYFSMPLIYSN